MAFGMLCNLAGAPVRMVRHLWGLRELIQQFTWREFVGRYRGAHLGVLLSLAAPIMLMIVYTLVFGVIFKASFGQDGGKAPLALALFSALIFFQLFSEVVGRAPTILLSNTNFITKVVFPLEILPFALLGTAFIHFLASSCVLLIGILLFNKGLPWTVFLLPVVVAPLLLLTSGLAWLLAALGIYFRDIDAVMPPFLMALTFLSAIFYPLSAIPEPFQLVALVNPMIGFSEMSRAILIFGVPPDWRIWLYCASLGCFVCVTGYFIFMRLKKGFSDAI